MDKATTRSIAFVTQFNPQDIHTWSWAGTFSHMARALEKYSGEVSWISPAPCKEQVIARSIHRSARLLLHRRYAYHNCLLVAKRHAHMIAAQLAKRRFDLIVAPVAATEIAFLETRIPIILVEDATYGQLINYNAEYTHLLECSKRELHIIEQHALQKASAIISSSSWAAQSAIDDYQADARKVHVVPFGANFETPPDAEMIRQRQRSGRCRLLFVGANWQQKGGDIAFETLLRLEQLGIEAELIICGCVPPPSFSHSRMRIIPFLDKQKPAERKELEHLYMQADFALLPTRNECFSIALCEATAYGLPVITTRTGGLSELVTDGKNGLLLPYDARGDAYAAQIAELYRDEQRYHSFVRASRTAFEKRLNWNAWGCSVKNIIDMSFRQMTQ
ncbi:glycosyl transferase [Reticulibacter mediterranei]|uniref:Glycosyl transferase n=1 Tax=Reticulibacter mediterranei TaxID=2778369 RepID=A0A8J3N6X4_9CHLR|nr:glycosyltransferase family 4 protein [Reticulibacter mediterranei]GHO98018.1 glycosyl transferase [Reticulibacter mediterranei]